MIESSPAATEAPVRPGKRGRLSQLALLAVFLALATPRVLHPTADLLISPFTDNLYAFYTDEGWIAHNARNHVLLGRWVASNQNAILTMPGMTFLQYLPFRLLGVGIWQARLLPMILSVASLWMFVSLMRRLHPSTGFPSLVALVLWGADTVDTMYSHSALAEKPALFFALSSLLCLYRGRTPGGWHLLAGLFFAAACGMKPLIAPLGAAVLIAGLVAAVIRRRRSPPVAGYSPRALLLFFIPVVLFAVAWLVFLHYSDVLLDPAARKSLGYYLDQRTGFSLQERVFALAKLGGHPYFMLQHPFLVVLALGGLASIVARLHRRGRALHFVEWVLLLWIVFQAGALALQFYQPTRWMALLGPGLAWLATEGLVWAWTAPLRLTIRSVAIGAAVLGAVVGAAAIMNVGDYGLYSTEAQRLADSSLTGAGLLSKMMWLLLAAGIVVVTGVWFARHVRWPLNVPRAVGASCAAAMLGLHLIGWGTVVGPWLVRPEYSMARARQITRAFIRDGDAVVSEFADNLFLDRRAIIYPFNAASPLSVRILLRDGPAASPRGCWLLINASSYVLPLAMTELPRLWNRNTMKLASHFPLLRNRKWRADFLLIWRRAVALDREAAAGQIDLAPARHGD